MIKKVDIELVNNIENDPVLKKSINNIIKKIKRKTIFSSIISIKSKIDKSNEKNCIKLNIVNDTHKGNFFAWMNAGINEWSIYLNDDNCSIIKNNWSEKKFEKSKLNLILVFIYEIAICKLIHNNLNFSDQAELHNSKDDFQSFILGLCKKHTEIDDDTSSCIFNFTIKKTNLKFKFEDPIICDDCKKHLLCESTLTKHEILKIHEEINNILSYSLLNRKFFSFLKNKYLFIVFVVSIILSLISISSLAISIISII